MGFLSDHSGKWIVSEQSSEGSDYIYLSLETWNLRVAANQWPQSFGFGSLWPIKNKGEEVEEEEEEDDDAVEEVSLCVSMENTWDLWTCPEIVL